MADGEIKLHGKRSQCYDTNLYIDSWFFIENHTKVVQLLLTNCH